MEGTFMCEQHFWGHVPTASGLHRHHRRDSDGGRQQSAPTHGCPPLCLPPSLHPTGLSHTQQILTLSVKNNECERLSCKGFVERFMSDNWNKLILNLRKLHTISIFFWSEINNKVDKCHMFHAHIHRTSPVLTHEKRSITHPWERGGTSVGWRRTWRETVGPLHPAPSPATTTAHTCDHW